MKTIRYCMYYHPARKDPAFYCWNHDEYVATLQTDERWIEVWAVGEMRINMPNGDVIRYTDDLYNAEIYSDFQLHNLDKNDDTFDIWENNNWFELRTYDGEWIGDVFSGHVYHDVEEALDACAELLQNEEFLAEYPCEYPEEYGRVTL